MNSQQDNIEAVVVVDEEEATAGASVADRIYALHRQLEQLAKSGKWGELTETMRQRDSLLTHIAAADHESVYRDAVRNNDALIKLAETEKQVVTDRLATLRRGRDLANRYAQQQAELSKPR